MENSNKTANMLILGIHKIAESGNLAIFVSNNPKVFESEISKVVKESVDFQSIKLFI